MKDLSENIFLRFRKQKFLRLIVDRFVDGIKLNNIVYVAHLATYTIREIYVREFSTYENIPYSPIRRQ